MSGLVDFMFWYFVVMCVVRFLTIGIAKYPRTIKYDIGVDVCSLFVYLAILAWVGAVKYGLVPT